MSFNDRTFPQISRNPPLGSIALTANRRDGTIQGLPKRPKLAGVEMALLNEIEQYIKQARESNYVGDDGLLETAPNSQRRIVDNTPCTPFPLLGEDQTKLLERGMAAFCMRALSSSMQQSMNRSSELRRFPTADQTMLDEYVVLAPHVLNYMLIERALDPDIPDHEKMPEFVHKMWDLRGFFSTDVSEAEFHRGIQVMVVNRTMNTMTVQQVWTGKLKPRDVLHFAVVFVPFEHAAAFVLNSSGMESGFNNVMPNGNVVTHVAQIYSFVTPNGVPHPKVLDVMVPHGLINVKVRGFSWRVGRVDCARKQGMSTARRNDDEVYNTLEMPFGKAMRSLTAFKENPSVEVFLDVV